MTLKIEDTARLPFELTKGDYKSRCGKINAANKRLFEKIIENVDNLTYKKLEELLTDEFVINGTTGKLKTKPLIKVKQLKNQLVAGDQSLIEDKGKIVGFKIAIPGNSEKIKKSFIAAFMHEATHYFELLFEPQILANTSLLNFDKEVEKRIENYYKNGLYKIEYLEIFNTLLSKIRLDIALRGLNNKDKIKVLKEYRNSLLMENFAYKISELYEIRATDKITKQQEIQDIFDFKFDEKIEFLERQIAQLIKKERKINKQKLNN